MKSDHSSRPNNLFIRNTENSRTHLIMKCEEKDDIYDIIRNLNTGNMILNNYWDFLGGIMTLYV